MSTPERGWGVMSISTEISKKIPAGWYPCRDNRARRRWWNGVEWTEYYAPIQKPTLRLVELEADTAESSVVEQVDVTRTSVADSAAFEDVKSPHAAAATSARRVSSVKTRTLSRFLIPLVCSLAGMETVLALLLIAHNAG